MSDNQWILATQKTRFPGTPLPGELFIPMFFLVIRIFSLWMWAFCITAMLVAIVLHMKGRSGGWMTRRFVSYLRGGRLNARPMMYRRRWAYLRSYDDLPLKEVRRLTAF